MAKPKKRALKKGADNGAATNHNLEVTNSEPEDDGTKKLARVNAVIRESSESLTASLESEPDTPEPRTQRVTVGTSKGPVSTIVERKPAPVVSEENQKLEPGPGPTTRTITMGSSKGPVKREVTLTSRSGPVDSA